MANFNIHYQHSETEKSQITCAVTYIMDIFLLEILAIQVNNVVAYSVCEMENGKLHTNYHVKKFLLKKKKNFSIRQKIVCI
jgi:hypothetical protein